MASLDRRLLDHIREAGLFPRAGTVLLAVSGGPDSVALLDLMDRLAPQLGVVLAVGHVDHGIRADSAAVAANVRALGGRYQVGVHVARLDLGATASETRARRARYRALRDMQRGIGAEYLATAHHADDQVETVLHRLLRGSGVSGLAGIAASGPRGLVRPLLAFRREDLTHWLAERYPDPAQRPPTHADPSNADPRHDRSWVRGTLLPMLRERFGSVLDRRVLDVARHAAGERAAWSTLLGSLPELRYHKVANGVEVALDSLRAYQPELGQAVLRALARECGLVLGPTRSQWLARFVARAASGRSVQLGQGFSAEVSFDRIRIFRTRASRAPDPVPWGATEQGGVRWGEWDIRWRPEAAGVARRSAWTTWIEPGTGVVRGPLPGDRLVPLGGEGSRPVARLLMEARVPRSARAAFPVLLRGDAPVWLPGICRARVAVPPAGRTALRVDACRRDGGVGAPEVVG